MSQQKSDEEAYEEAILRLVKQFESNLRKNFRPGIQPLDEIENQAEKIGETAKETIVKEIVEECGSGYTSTRIGCSCGGRARYTQISERHIVTLHGVVSIPRAYYYCGVCRKGFCPLDFQLGLGSGECSRAVQSLLARFCSYLSFEDASEELEVICKIQLSPTTVQRYAKQIGNRIADDWHRDVDRMEALRLPSSGQRVKRLYLSMDGVMVHVGGDWHEVKLGVAYQRSVTGKAVHKNYYATTKRSPVFGKHIRVLAHRSGSDTCSDIEMVADGAPWIWKETGKHFPQSTQVIDYYHVTQHLWIAANSRFGENTAQAKEWMDQQHQHLLAENIAVVIAAVQEWRPTKRMDKTQRRRLITYLNVHRHRMNYKSLRDKGYDIASGICEASNKNVVKSRMNAAGMRWEEPGAEAILQLSTYCKSAYGDNFFPFTA